MLQKNIDKNKRKERPTWNGYYQRKSPTKRDYEIRLDRKYRKVMTCEV